MTHEEEKAKLIEAFRREPENRTLTMGAWRRLGLRDRELFDAAYPRPLPEPERYDYPADDNYDAMVTAAGEKILAEEYVGSYQGDIYYLLQSASQFAFVRVGYGSCSGCDALQMAQGDRERMLDLRWDIWSGIQWKSRGELQAWLESKDATTEWDADELRPVLDKFAEVLRGAP